MEGHNLTEEAIMNLRNIDLSKCDRAEKEVVEGFCLSYDMIRDLCLETMEKCEALRKDTDKQ